MDVYHRTDACCIDRLVGADVIVSTTQDFAGGRACGVLNESGGHPELVRCSAANITGQFVTISTASTRNYLTLCAVQVFGRPGPELLPVPELGFGAAAKEDCIVAEVGRASVLEIPFDYVCPEIVAGADRIPADTRSEIFAVFQQGTTVTVSRVDTRHDGENGWPFDLFFRCCRRSRSVKPQLQQEATQLELIRTRCRGLCAGYQFMGISFSDRCSCGNEYGRYGASVIPDRECGESGRRCGTGNESLSASW
eukprot:SAG22_NODE_4400_length_1282_cov_1.267117_1_plen_252_part_00